MCSVKCGVRIFPYHFALRTKNSTWLSSGQIAFFRMFLCPLHSLWKITDLTSYCSLPPNNGWILSLCVTFKVVLPNLLWNFFKMFLLGQSGVLPGLNHAFCSKTFCKPVRPLLNSWICTQKKWLLKAVLLWLLFGVSE